MPIKPENKHRYPADWDERRKAVLERAGDRCELCGAPNGRWIARHEGTPSLWVEVQPNSRAAFGYGKAIRVILTTAHLDHEYQCHDEKCLLALCQRCHLKIDAHQRHLARIERSGNESVQRAV